MAQFGGRGAMACPSDRSPDNSDTLEEPSGMLLTHAEPQSRAADEEPVRLPGSGRFSRSSTRSWSTTKTPLPSSGTPPLRSSGGSATSTTTAAAMPRCNATCASTGRGIKETFIPLGHLPGQRLEADFGHIHVDFPDGRRLVPFLVTAWAYSNAPFVLALPFERTEAILEGMVAAFEFFGAVPKEVWWDNPRTVATLILLGRERQLHPRYAALASHYVFDPALLHAGPRQREARRRGHRQGRAEAVRHARASRRRSRRVERVLSQAVARPSATGSCSRSSARSRSRTASPRTSPSASPLAQASVRPLRDQARGRGRQVSIRRLRRQSLQRAPAVRVRDGDGQGLRRPRRDRRATARSSPLTNDRWRSRR